jgi:3-oxoacid CoA-transferase subunit B
MEHRAKDGSSKLVPKCTLPLTGPGVVQRVITDLAVLDITDSGFLLREVAPGVTADDVRHATAAPVTVTPISPRRQSNLPSDAPGPPLAR